MSVIGRGIQQWAAQRFAPQVEFSRAPFEFASKSVNGLTQVGDRIQQSVRNNFFKPEDARYLVGSYRVPGFAPGQGFMKVIENLVPTMHPFAAVHEALLGSLRQGGMPIAIPGVPFLFHPANVPTMPLAYVAGVAGAVFNTATDVISG